MVTHGSILLFFFSCSFKVLVRFCFAENGVNTKTIKSFSYGPSDGQSLDIPEQCVSALLVKSRGHFAEVSGGGDITLGSCWSLLLDLSCAIELDILALISVQ